MQPVSKAEFVQFKDWFDENQSLMPSEMANFLKRILAVYLSFAQGYARAKKTLQALRIAMGFVPKSERGATDSAQTPEPLPGADDNLTPEEKERYEGLIKKRKELIAKKLEIIGHLF